MGWIKGFHSRQLLVAVFGVASRELSCSVRHCCGDSEHFMHSPAPTPLMCGCGVLCKLLVHKYTIFVMSPKIIWTFAQFCEILLLPIRKFSEKPSNVHLVRLRCAVRHFHVVYWKTASSNVGDIIFHSESQFFSPARPDLSAYNYLILNRHPFELAVCVCVCWAELCSKGILKLRQRCSRWFWENRMLFVRFATSNCSANRQIDDANTFPIYEYTPNQTDNRKFPYWNLIIKMAFDVTTSWWKKGFGKCHEYIHAESTLRRISFCSRCVHMIFIYLWPPIRHILSIHLSALLGRELALI